MPFGGVKLSVPSYEEMIQEFINARTELDETAWKQAAIAFYLKMQMDADSKTISQDTGFTPRYISQLVRTYGAFPDEGDRALDLSFSHHMKAAETEDPNHWLSQAIENQWSVRDMQKAINGEKPQPSQYEQAEKLWNKVMAMIDEGGPGAEFLKEQIRMAEVVVS